MPKGLRRQDKIAEMNILNAMTRSNGKRRLAALLGPALIFFAAGCATTVDWKRSLVPHDAKLAVLLPYRFEANVPKVKHGSDYT